MSWVLDRNGTKTHHWYRYLSSNQNFELFVIVKDKRKTEFSVTISSLVAGRKAVARHQFYRTSDTFRSVLGEIKAWASDEIETPFARMTRQLVMSF